MQGIGEQSPSNLFPSDRSSALPFGSELLDMIQSMEKARVLGAADGPVLPQDITASKEAELAILLLLLCFVLLQSRTWGEQLPV